MNLNVLRHILLLRGGEIRAWALTEMSFKNIVAEIPPHIRDAKPEVGDLIHGIPVVIVRPGEPEGVIV